MKYITNLDDFYKTDEWEKLKSYLMMSRLNEQGELICEHCGKPIVKKYDCIGHHKKELTLENVNDAQVSLNQDNIAMVHVKCHNEIHNRFGYYKPKVILIHGSVCSGKSTYVKELANKDDLILDMDDLWTAISNNPKYIKPQTLKSVVFAMRDCLMEQIKMRNGKWHNAYILSTSPYAMERKRMIDRLGVDKVIHIDTPLEECLQRLYENPNGRNITEYEGYIKDYFKNYQEQ